VYGGMGTRDVIDCIVLNIRIRCIDELCCNCFQYRKQSPEDETTLTL